MQKKQLHLNLCQGKQGGRRSGSGRKRLHSKGVAHRIREHINRRTPVHINFRYKTQIRNKDALRVLKKAPMYSLISRSMIERKPHLLMNTLLFFR